MHVISEVVIDVADIFVVDVGAVTVVCSDDVVACVVDDAVADVIMDCCILMCDTSCSDIDDVVVRDLH